MRRPLALAAVAAAALLGCSGATWGVSRQLDNGRQVAVSSDQLRRRMWVEPGFESTTARIGLRTVTVEPTRIEVDDRFVGTIDEVTKCVQINEQRDKLQILADEKAVYEAPF